MLLAAGIGAADPTIQAIANQTTAEDTAISVAIVVADADGGTLTVTGDSSNDGLVADNAIVPNADNTAVTITPTANQSGTTTITLTVRDLQNNPASTGFTLTVSPVNDPPVFTNLDTTLSTAEDTLVSETFDVADIDSAIDGRAITAASSNQVLIPNSGVVVADNQGGSRRIEITPALNQTGTAVITLTLTDGNGGTATADVTVTVTAVNDAPTFVADVGNQTTAEDTGKSVDFAVADADNDPATLTVTATSGNQGLVTDAGLVVSAGAGGARTLAITPVPNANGTVTITLTVRDAGNLTATDTFTLTITAVNDPPVFTAIADQTTNEDTAKEVEFQVDDVDDDLTFVVASATSSNTALVPNATVGNNNDPGFRFLDNIGEGGDRRRVRINPNRDASGETTITLRINDGDDDGAISFRLTVTADNDAPTITAINDQDTLEDQVETVAITVADTDTSAAALLVTATSGNQALVADAGLVVTANGGGSRTLTIAPVPNANGTVTITVTVSDGVASASDSFQLRIDPVNDAPALAAIADQAPAQNQTIDVALVITDIDNVNGPFNVIATSDSQAVVANGGLSDDNRTRLTITPIRNAVGSARITVIVSDTGGLSATQSFNCTLGNAAPTLEALVPEAVRTNGRSAAFRALFSEDIDAATVSGADFVARVTAGGVTTVVANGGTHPQFGVVTIAAATISPSVQRVTANWTASADGSIAVAAGGATFRVADTGAPPLISADSALASAATIVDATAPAVSSTSVIGANPTGLSSVVFQVLFSEDVDPNTVTAADFALQAVANSGSFGAIAITAVEPNLAATSVCTVNVAWNPQGILSGTLRLVTAGAFAVSDLAGNVGSVRFDSGQLLVIDPNFPVDGRQAFTSLPPAEVEVDGRFEYTPATLINRTNDPAFDTAFTLRGLGSLATFNAPGENATFDPVTGRLVLPRVPLAAATAGYLDFAIENAISADNTAVQAILLKVTAGPGAGN